MQAFLAALDPSDLELGLRIALQILLLVGAACFAGSETALFSLSRLDLQKLRLSRNPRSEKIHELLDEPRRLIISILCGNELVSIASVANMAAILVMLYGHETAAWANILIMVPLLLLFGEVTPKTFAVTFPKRFASLISAPLLPRWMVFITPLRVGVRFLADRITTFIVGEPVTRENILQPDEFRTLVEDGAANGVLDATERVLIDNMLKASETEVYHVMTPRTRINFIDGTLPMDEIIELFRSYQHPRVPVVRHSEDNIIGFLQSEDLLRLIHSKVDPATVTLDSILRPAHFVPPTKKVDEMFDYFQTHHTRAAIILGEFGGVAGIVTMKDVLTFIFGEISGTLQARGQVSASNEDGSFSVPGDMRLTDFRNVTGLPIEDPLMTTIGGFVFRLFDYLPQVGESTSYEGIHFTILQRDGLRLGLIGVSRSSPGGGLAAVEEAVPLPPPADHGAAAPAVPAPEPPAATQG
ncbi:MAG: HlyC/CorC family transporter [Magnetococcales bacterium]|nr:HlyC/CorC family transporter [Magnetococcales bacterium]